VTDLDPYTILGVARTASRDEIARAYRALAKRHHPDAGATPSAAMARINEAWHVLSDTTRRARWDRLHTIVEPAHWVPTPPPTEIRSRRPPPQPAAPPSRMDSGWAAAAVVIGVVVFIAVAMVGVSLASAPTDDRVRFDSDELTFLHPPEWMVAAGDPDDPAEHQIVAHLVTFGVEPDRLCTSFGATCPLDPSQVPPGEASIIVTAWEGGTPPVPDPVVSRPYGLHADTIIGGEPAAVDREEVDEGTTLIRWQLSPPGFPDRWIEVTAVIRGLVLDQTGVLDDIEALLRTVEFRD
jgi:DnaJ domain